MAPHMVIPAGFRTLPLYITLMLVACAALVIGNAATVWSNLRELTDASSRINRSWAVINKLYDLRNHLVDAETGQRGYLLTGNPIYLEPFRSGEASYPEDLSTLLLLIADNPVQVRHASELQELVEERFKELSTVVELTEQGKANEALAFVRSGHGKQTMDTIRGILANMQSAELELLSARNNRSYRRYQLTAWLGAAISGVTLLTLILFYTFILRNVLRRRAAELELRAANETLESKVLQRTAQLSQLSRHLLAISEKEKAALASELHDELGANLTAINLDVTSVAARLKETAPDLAARLKRALGLLHATVELKRRIIQGLHPSMLDALGLAAAMRMHCEDFTRRTGLPCDADVPEDFGEVDPAWAIALYRIAQEALNNTAKYAHGKNVRIVLRRETQGIRLSIIDDGVGIDPQAIDKPLSHGLLGMRERVRQLGGVFVVRRGNDDRGTIVEAFIPFPDSCASP